MATVYKFMHSKYLEGFYSGSKVKLGSIDEYRGDSMANIGHQIATFSKPENVFDDFFGTRVSDESHQKAHNILAAARHIGDPLEGTSLSRQVQHIDESGAVYMNNMFVNRTPNHLLFCCSIRDDRDVRDRVVRDSLLASSTPYDVIVPILRPDRFADSITQALQRLYTGGQKVTCTHQSVDYGELGRDFYDVPLDEVIKQTTSNPFIKDKSFTSQAEYRFVFDPPLDPDEKGCPISVDYVSPDILGTPRFIS